MEERVQGPLAREGGCPRINYLQDLPPSEFLVTPLFIGSVQLARAALKNHAVLPCKVCVAFGHLIYVLDRAKHFGP